MIDLYELAAADPSLRYSPHCWRIRMALAHKGLHARFVPWHYGDKRLPGGKGEVPVLVDDGEVIADSTAIALHLEDKYADGPSLFGDEAAIAHARFVIAWTDTVLQPAIFPLVALETLKYVKPAAQAYYRESREKRIGMPLEKAAGHNGANLQHARDAMHPLRRVVDAEPFLGGDEPSYADYAAFGAFMWARVLGVEILDEDDPVYAWRERMLELFDGLAGEARTVA